MSTPRRVTIADLSGRLVAGDQEVEKEENQPYGEASPSISVTSLDGGARLVAMSELVANGEQFKPERGLQVLLAAGRGEGYAFARSAR